MVPDINAVGVANGQGAGLQLMSADDYRVRERADRRSDCRRGENQHETGGGVADSDDLFYDAARRRLYVSGGEGYIDVVQEGGDGRLSRTARVTTASGARTSLFVADQSRLYLAVPHRGSQRAEIRVYEAR